MGNFVTFAVYKNTYPASIVRHNLIHAGFASQNTWHYNLMTFSQLQCILHYDIQSSVRHCQQLFVLITPEFWLRYKTQWGGLCFPVFFTTNWLITEWWLCEMITAYWILFPVWTCLILFLSLFSEKYLLSGSVFLAVYTDKKLSFRKAQLQWLRLWSLCSTCDSSHTA